MKFLVDEGADKSIVDGLREMDFDVYYVIEQIRSLEDDILLKIADEENRILITRDKDFGELVFRLNKAHRGVILIRLEGYTTDQRAEIVCRLIFQHLSELPGSFTVIQKEIIRIRPRTIK
jgi:predicted nuclease of predicted toxin-antitoxin system